jgi:hypothetical protein
MNSANNNVEYSIWVGLTGKFPEDVSVNYTVAAHDLTYSDLNS